MKRLYEKHDYRGKVLDRTLSEKIVKLGVGKKLVQNILGLLP